MHAGKIFHSFPCKTKLNQGRFSAHKKHSLNTISEKIKKIFTLAAIVMAAFPTQAQLKVRLLPGPPQPSALLDASNIGAATKTGFLAPQV